MKFKIDENLSIEVAELLRQTGYDTAIVLEQDLNLMVPDNLAADCRRQAQT